MRALDKAQPNVAPYVVRPFFPMKQIILLSQGRRLTISRQNIPEFFES